MNLFKPLPLWRCCRRLQARSRSQKHCEGKHVTTTFPQEVSEPELPTNLGASTTILRTRSIVLMSIEANAPQQQQEGSANVRPTPFGRLHARAAGPPHIWTPPWSVACSTTPSHDRRRTASAAWPQRGSVFHQGRIFNFTPTMSKYFDSCCWPRASLRCLSHRTPRRPHHRQSRLHGLQTGFVDTDTGFGNALNAAHTVTTPGACRCDGHSARRPGDT